MAYVINGGDQPTTNFQKFTDMCCAAYNELRKHSSLLLSLLSLVGLVLVGVNIILRHWVETVCYVC